MHHSSAPLPLFPTGYEPGQRVRCTFEHLELIKLIVPLNEPYHPTYQRKRALSTPLRTRAGSARTETQADDDVGHEDHQVEGGGELRSVAG